MNNNEFMNNQTNNQNSYNPQNNQINENNNQYNNQNNYNSVNNQINQNVVTNNYGNSIPIDEPNNFDDNVVTAKDIASGIFITYLARHGAMWGFTLAFLAFMAILFSGLTKNPQVVQLVSILVIIIGIILIIVGAMAKVKYYKIRTTNPVVKAQNKSKIIYLIIGIIIAIIKLILEYLKK